MDLDEKKIRCIKVAGFLALVQFDVDPRSSDLKLC